MQGEAGTVMEKECLAGRVCSQKHVRKEPGYQNILAAVQLLTKMQGSLELVGGPISRIVFYKYIKLLSTENVSAKTDFTSTSSF